MDARHDQRQGLPTQSFEIERRAEYLEVFGGEHFLSGNT